MHIHFTNPPMDGEGIVVCEKHQKRETNMAMISTNYYICMNRYCPNAYQVLCSSCRPDHRDHTINILSIEDICFLIDRLLKMPFKQVGLYMSQTVEVMKKLKLIREFKDKIDTLQVSIQEQTESLVHTTEMLISEYAQCKKAAHEAAEVMFQIEDPSTFRRFQSQTIKLLARMNYNFQKDIMEYGSPQIKDKLEQRRKLTRGIAHKIEEVKEYSMKIIEVILNEDESDEEEEDILLKKKNYEELKAELHLIQEAAQTPPTASQIQKVLKSVKSMSIQTESERSSMVKDKERNETSRLKMMESKLELAASTNKKMESEFKAKLILLQKQKQSLIKERESFNKQKQKINRDKEKAVKASEKKVELLNHYEKRLRDNRSKRIHRQKEREEVLRRLSKLIEQQKSKSKEREGEGSRSRSKAKDLRMHQ